MTKEEKLELFEAIEGEGFNYAFSHYSDWKEIKDKEFHILRKAYLKAEKSLNKYIGWQKCEESGLGVYEYLGINEDN